LSGYILRRDDGEFFPGNAVCEMDTKNLSAGSGTPHGHSVDHLREIQIVDIARAAGDLSAAFLAGNRFSDLLVFGWLMFGAHSSIPRVLHCAGFCAILAHLLWIRRKTHVLPGIFAGGAGGERDNAEAAESAEAAEKAGRSAI
jgi:hypothetical protein